MLSCCAFAQADLNIFVSRSWQFYRSKHQTFTNEQRQLGSDCARACGMINGKKQMRFMFACAGLTLTPRVQVYLCLRCYHKLCGGQRTSTIRLLRLCTRRYLEYVHCYFILLRINKQKTILSSFCPYFFFFFFFYKIIIIIYANMHVTIT